MKRTTPIKVLMIVNNLSVADGVASYAMTYFRNINKNHIWIDFVALQHLPSPYYQEIERAGAKVYHIPHTRSFSDYKKACRRIFDTNTYDIVHDNSLLRSLPLMWYARKANIPVRILHSHSSKLGSNVCKSYRNKLLIPVLKAQANQYTACAQDAGKALFGKRSFTVISNAIDRENFYFDQKRRQEIRQKMNVEHKFVVGTVGRLAEEKNPFFALDVFAKLMHACADSEYWWVGDGSLKEKAQEYADHLGITEHVRFLGNRIDVADLYQGMDCFFMPSFFEGLSIACVEAQAIGLPCVLSDGIPNEMIYTDLIEYASLQQPAQYWAERILSKRDAYERRGYTKELCESRFEIHVVASELEKLYQTMLDGIE